MNVREELFKYQELQYRDFHAKLLPGVDKSKLIGVRMPKVREIARQAVKEHIDFEPEYYEEVMVYGLKIGYERCSVQKHLEKLKDFVPMIDNWAVCDCCCSTYKFAKKYQKEVWDFIMPYLNGSTYQIRFAVVMMMDYYLNDEYIDEVVDILLNLKSEEYYVNMALAWAFSVIYVKYKDKMLSILENKQLEVWVHNKTIQKICESFRVDKEDKNYLKTLKIK